MSSCDYASLLRYVIHDLLHQSINILPPSGKALDPLIEFGRVAQSLAAHTIHGEGMVRIPDIAPECAHAERAILSRALEIQPSLHLTRSPPDDSPAPPPLRIETIMPHQRRWPAQCSGALGPRGDGLAFDATQPLCGILWTTWTTRISNMASPSHSTLHLESKHTRRHAAVARTVFFRGFLEKREFVRLGDARATDNSGSLAGPDDRTRDPGGQGA